MRFGSSVCGAVCLGAVFLASSAFAADAVGDRFFAMDKNKDSRISWDEFSSVNPNISRKGFDTMDLNKDEHLSVEEWRTFYENHGMNVPAPSSSKMMPSQPATAPQVMPPAKPGTASPVNPARPADPKAGKPEGMMTGKGPNTPEAPRVGGMPLLTPPSVKGPTSPAVNAPATPSITAPTVPPVGIVKPSAPTGKASNNIPLLSPPKIPGKTQESSPSEGKK